MLGTTGKMYLMAWLTGGALLISGLSGCSDSDGDDENLNSDKNDSAGNLGEDDAHEGNGQENYVDNDESKAGKGGADVNSDTAAAGADAGAAAGGNGVFNDAGAAPAGNAGAAANPAAGGDPTAGGALAGNAAGGANAAPPANAAPAAAAPAAKTASAPAPGGPMAPKEGGRVRYVKEGGIQVVSAPNGSPVMTLDQGEHPVTWEENGWLKITDGMYVPVDGMSNKGIPRSNGPQAWSH